MQFATCFVIFRHNFINQRISLSVLVGDIRIELSHSNALYSHFHFSNRCFSRKKFIIIFFSISVLQIALFYVAVLAGLLHRFPVSFSQVRTFTLIYFS